MVDESAMRVVVPISLACGISTVIFIIHIYTRMAVLRLFVLEDAYISASWASSLALAGTSLAARSYGLGWHLGSSEHVNAPAVDRIVSIGFILFVWCNAFARSAFASLYIRILQTHWLVNFNRLLIGIMTGQAIAQTIALSLQCRPDPQKSEDGSGACINLVPLEWTMYGLNIVTGLILFIEPIPFLLRLRLSCIKWVGIGVMIFLGLMVCGVATLCAIFTTRGITDLTYDLALPVIWAQMQALTMMTCYSIPSLRKIVLHVSAIRSSQRDSCGSDDKTEAARNGANDAQQQGQEPLKPRFWFGSSVASSRRSCADTSFASQLDPRLRSTDRTNYGMVSFAERAECDNHYDNVTDEKTKLPIRRSNSNATKLESGGGDSAGSMTIVEIPDSGSRPSSLDEILPLPLSPSTSTVGSGGLHPPPPPRQTTHQIPPERGGILVTQHFQHTIIDNPNA